MDKNQMVANEINNMKLSERARNLVAGTEIRLYAEMFGGCDADTIEKMAMYKIYGNECLYDEIYDSYEEAREVADEYEEKDGDGTRYHVVDGFENWLD